MKRLVAITLILSLLLSTAPFCALAAEQRGEKPGQASVASASLELSLFQSGISLSGARAEQPQYAAALEKLEQGVSNYMSSVRIDQYNIPLDQFANLFADLLYGNPQFFYLDPYVECQYDQDSFIIYSMELHYLYSLETAETMKKEIDKKVSQIMDMAGKLQSDLEKILYIHDYLALNCSYDVELSRDSYNIYGCLINRRAVCQGYALASKYLFDLLNIPCNFVNSDPMNHGWTLVELDGSWYHMDPTWDDPLPDMLGRVRHQNFLKSDAAMRANGYSGWDADKTADNTKYDEYFWNTVSTAFIALDDGLFYISNDGVLMKWNAQTNQTQQLPSTQGKWFYWGNPSVYYTEYYANLVQANGLLYYNTDTKIYSIKPDGTDNKAVFELPKDAQGYIYGIQFIDGELVYALKTSPTAEETLCHDAGILDTSFDVEQSPYTLGDVNGDGVISVSDVLLAQKKIAKILELTQQQFDAADVNRDGEVSAYDVTQIQRKIAGMISGFQTAA